MTLAPSSPSPTTTGNRWCTCHPGATVWLTGLPSAGKTTLALALSAVLREEGRRVEVLDGDVMRSTLSAGLGFSREDREANVARIGLMSEVLSRNGVLTLVPVIAPFAESRAAVRDRHDRSATTFLEVHVATSVQLCEARDVKGLYAKHKAGRLTGLTGVDAPYEAPARPDLRIETDAHSVEESVVSLRALLFQRGLA